MHDWKPKSSLSLLIQKNFVKSVNLRNEMAAIGLPMIVVPMVMKVSRTTDNIAKQLFITLMIYSCSSLTSNSNLVCKEVSKLFSPSKITVYCCID
jgi:hypothetical protein